MKSCLFRAVLIIAPLILSLESFGQETEAEITDISRVTILPPGLSYEKKVARLQSLYGQVFAAFNASFSASSDFGAQFDLSVDPAVLFQYRYYYNGDRRASRGKRTEMNSMNYLAPVFATTLSRSRIVSDNFLESKRRFVNNIGIVWGMQRNYDKRLSIDLNLGINYLFAKGTTGDMYGNYKKVDVHQVSPVVKLIFGFWLNKRLE